MTILAKYNSRRRSWKELSCGLACRRRSATGGRLSGKLPGPHCPTKLAIFAPHTVPVDTCDWHTLRNGKVRINYPDELRAWANRAGKEL